MWVATKPEEKGKPGFVDSHALCEVRTKKGWLVVDSLTPWLSLDKQGEPISLRTLQRSVIDGQPIPLDAMQANLTPNLLRRPFTIVYGLYARHGRFYQRYPNINPREFCANFTVDT